jgi:hypothetical protein
MRVQAGCPGCRQLSCRLAQLAVIHTRSLCAKRACYHAIQYPWQSAALCLRCESSCRAYSQADRQQLASISSRGLQGGTPGCAGARRSLRPAAPSQNCGDTNWNAHEHAGACAGAPAGHHARAWAVMSCIMLGKRESEQCVLMLILGRHCWQAGTPVVAIAGNARGFVQPCGRIRGYRKLAGLCSASVRHLESGRLLTFEHPDKVAGVVEDLQLPARLLVAQHLQVAGLDTCRLSSNQ